MTIPSELPQLCHQSRLCVDTTLQLIYDAYMNHEESVVTAFFLPNRHERYLEIVRDPKKRGKLINELSHFKQLNPQFIVPITPNQQHVPQLMSLLRSKGAPAKCWVISEDRIWTLAKSTCKKL